MFGEQDVNVDGTEVVLTNLSKFHEYVVRVVAYNVNGPGPATDELTCRTYSDGNLPFPRQVVIVLFLFLSLKQSYGLGN